MCWNAFTCWRRWCWIGRHIGKCVFLCSQMMSAKIEESLFNLCVFNNNSIDLHGVILNWRWPWFRWLMTHWNRKKWTKLLCFRTQREIVCDGNSIQMRFNCTKSNERKHEIPKKIMVFYSIAMESIQFSIGRWFVWENYTYQTCNRFACARLRFRCVCCREWRHLALDVRQTSFYYFYFLFYIIGDEWKQLWI